MWFDRLINVALAVANVVVIYKLIGDKYDITFADVACMWLVVAVSVISTNVYELLKRATEGSE